MDNFVAQLFSIAMINLLLSGDNAVVIGMAVRGLPAKLKRQAILIGGASAIILRVILTVVAAELLQIPLLEVAGGIILAWVTYDMLVPSTPVGSLDEPPVMPTFAGAMRIIIIADLTMSLDNALAVGAASGGDLLLLVIGLTLSMVVIIAGGSLISILLERMNWLVYVGAIVLLIVAGGLLADDRIVRSLLGNYGWLSWALAGVLGLAVGTALLVRRARHSHRKHGIQAR